MLHVILYDNIRREKDLFLWKKYCLKFHHLEMPNNRISSEQFAFFCECKGKLVIRRLNKFINKLDVAHLKAE